MLICIYRPTRACLCILWVFLYLAASSIIHLFSCHGLLFYHSYFLTAILDETWLLLMRFSKVLYITNSKLERRDLLYSYSVQYFVSVSDGQ